MAGTRQPIFYVAFMRVVGLGIPILAALDGGLATRLQNPMPASTIELLAAIAIVVTALLVTEGVPRSTRSRRSACSAAYR
jgi:transporter family-2 protein